MRAGSGAVRTSAVGNYVLTGRVLGKGHFARVEEATHALLHQKVAIKVIDLTCIREEYARRNLHREPRLMVRLSHPCIAALYETMMHGPRLYMVMEAACGGDLSELVLAARGGRARGGLPERRARTLSAQLVSAVKHMHERGVVHRDLKMENIMLDSTKQFIKIVDFGLSNVWTAGGGLRTPCGSLEYAAPELLAPGAAPARRYGPPLDLWSVGVIVYGMVTGALPFSTPENVGRAADGGSRDRPQLRQMIARGLGQKQRAALAVVSPECSGFVSRLLETRVEARMPIEEAARHGWLRECATGRRLRIQPLPPLNRQAADEIYQRIAMLCESDAASVATRASAAPLGALGGMYRIEAHRRQLAAATAGGGVDGSRDRPQPARRSGATPVISAHIEPDHGSRFNLKPKHTLTSVKSPSSNLVPSGQHAARAAVPLDSGDGEPPKRLPSICERVAAAPFRLEKRALKPNANRTPAGVDVEHSSADGRRSTRLRCCPQPTDPRHTVNYHQKAGDGLPRLDFSTHNSVSWHSSSVPSTPLRKVPKNTVPIKRPSHGYSVSPNQPIDNQCKSENGTLVKWSLNKGMKESAHMRFQRNLHPKGTL